MRDMTNDTLAIILGGGQGSRLFPLTATRSKPAVPIGGKYRLIDVPVSGCLHADIRRIFVLTQFNSASLNRHISNTYRLDQFSGGFVEILAAEQTPDNPHWFQGTADAVRQAVRHIAAARGGVLPHPRRRPSVPHGLLRADRCPQGAACGHHDRRAAGRSRDRDADGHLPLRHATAASSPSKRSRSHRGCRRLAGASRRAPRSRRTPTNSRSWPRWASTCSPGRSCSTCWIGNRASTSAAS